MLPEKAKSHSLIPPKWQERFLLKRIDEEPMEISLEVRNEIIRAMQGDQRFVQIGKYTIMINSIKSIEPKWGKTNIPPCPKPQYDFNDKNNAVVVNQDEINEWNELFADIQR